MVPQPRAQSLELTRVIQQAEQHELQVESARPLFIYFYKRTINILKTVGTDLGRNRLRVRVLIVSDNSCS